MSWITRVFAPSRYIEEETQKLLKIEQERLALEKKQFAERIMLEEIQRREEEEAEQQRQEEIKMAAAQLLESTNAKTLATAAGEPWVAVTKINLDDTGGGAGSFEMDWNDIFVARLMKAGYTGDTDAAIVDQWFTETCRAVAMEIWEQHEANEAPGRRVQSRRNPDGTLEVS